MGFLGFTQGLQYLPMISMMGFLCTSPSPTYLCPLSPGPGCDSTATSCHSSLSCSHSNLPYTPVALIRARLRIYRYELPWHVSFPLELNDGWPTYDHMYSAFERFFETFSGDWVVSAWQPLLPHPQGAPGRGHLSTLSRL